MLFLFITSIYNFYLLQNACLTLIFQLSGFYIFYLFYIHENHGGNHKVMFFQFFNINTQNNPRRQSASVGFLVLSKITTFVGENQFVPYY